MNLDSLTHFVTWFHKTPGCFSSPKLHQEVWEATDPSLIQKQHAFTTKARSLTGDGGFFFRRISANEAQNIQTY